VVARVYDSNLKAAATDFSAIIAWGNGDTTAGSIVYEHPGRFAILGSYTYTSPGTYAVTAVIEDEGGSSVVASTTVTVAGAAPMVTGLTPITGPPAGGTSVNIQGVNLIGATAVSFGNTPATGFALQADGTINALSPLHSPGTLDVTVTTPFGTSAVSAADQFTFTTDRPAITGLSPSSGPSAGGNTVTITGTALGNATGVFFGTVPAASFSVTSSTSITAVVPLGQASSFVDVSVVTPYGASPASLADHYTYAFVAPSVTGINPTAGPLSGGTEVAIQGANLDGATQVLFGNIPAQGFTVVSPDAIMATSPSYGGGDVTVQKGSSTSGTSSADQFTEGPVPAITGVYPSGGPGASCCPTAGGGVVDILGTDFNYVTQVYFGLTPALHFVVYDVGWMQAWAPPAAAGTVDVRLQSVFGLSAIVSNDQCAYLPSAPVVTGISLPSQAPLTGGTVVTITGLSLTEANQVTFGTAPAADFKVVSPTEITATAPAGAAGVVDIHVTNPYGTSAASSADQFTYVDAAPPVLTGLSPAIGATNGGDAVALQGSGLIAGGEVLFGGVPAPIWYLSGQPYVITPPGTPGTVEVQVITPYGASLPSSFDDFTYLVPAFVGQPPVVTSISPTSGPISGGTVVQIHGANLAATTQVYFTTDEAWVSPLPAADFTVVSDNLLTATTPPCVWAFCWIAVATPAGTAESSQEFSFIWPSSPPPTVTGLSPGSGPTVGGNLVNIIGTNLLGTTRVSFGSTLATMFQVNTSTSITATAPPGVIGTVDVTVRTDTGTSALTSADHYNYMPVLPSVTAITPASGPEMGGTSVHLTGTHFTGATAVSFGGVAAPTFSVNTDSLITATAPTQAPGTVDVTVTTPAGTSATSSADLYTYQGMPPTISALTPSSALPWGGTTVVISGANFINVGGVAFGGTDATSFHVDSPTQITAVCPAHDPGLVFITVSNLYGNSNPSNSSEFLYLTPPVPVVTGVAPSYGPIAGGSSVTITGTGFTGAGGVSFGTLAASSYTVLSDTQIKAITPTEGAGIVDVRVTNISGTSPTSSADQYMFVPPQPAVTAVSPNTDTTAGGTPITIHGMNFTNATGVFFGTAPATVYFVPADDTLIAFDPVAAAGTVHISVRNSFGTSSLTSADQFTYQATTSTPTVTGLNPNHGFSDGGTQVTVTGTNLSGTSQCWFGNVMAPCTVTSSTTLTATAPPGFGGIVHVTVVTPTGISSPTSADEFTYILAPPTVTGVSPNTATTAGGTTVTIAGTHLSTVTAIYFGNLPAYQFTLRDCPISGLRQPCDNETRPACLWARGD
jgi:hypothetical protein